MKTHTWKRKKIRQNFMVRLNALCCINLRDPEIPRPRFHAAAIQAPIPQPSSSQPTVSSSRLPYLVFQSPQFATKNPFKLPTPAAPSPEKPLSVPHPDPPSSLTVPEPHAATTSSQSSVPKLLATQRSSPQLY